MLLLPSTTLLGSNFSSNHSQAIQSPAPATLAKVPYQFPSVLTEARPTGTISPSARINVGVILPPKDSLGLNLFLNSLYNPSSSNYHHFLTSSQFSELYGPDSSEGSLLISYFESQGLVASIDPSNSYIVRATGTARGISNAFNVEMQTYQYRGSSFFSPTISPRLPAQFSNVQMVYGLDDFASHSQPSAVPFYRTLGQVPGIPTTGNFLYYSPSEIKQIYNISSLSSEGYDGSGVAIAIVDAYGDPYIQQEVDNFSTQFNLPTTTVNVICVDGPCTYSSGITQGWNTEIALDVEWAHALAPGAKINLYIGSNSSQPLFDAVERAVQDGTNSIISMSWGSPENTFGESSAYNPIVAGSYPWLDQVFQQAAAEGITAFSSTGDSGAYDQGSGQSSPFGGPSYPSTDPFVTAVGGTSLYINSTSGYIQYPFSNASGSYGSETAWSWNNAFNWGTGGGYSTLFSKPAWQNVGTSNSMRGVPDVSWVADVQTGVIVGIYDQTTRSLAYQIVGGTSVGSPSWAGSLAVMIQKAGQKLGTINPLIYSILQNTTEYSKAFHDITQGDNNPLSAGPGWDPVTGIGSPNVGELSTFFAPFAGGIGVAVNNSLSGELTASYSYGSSVTLNAKVSVPPLSNYVTVRANISSPSGSIMAENIPMSFNNSTKLYGASYQISAAEPPGEWSATVEARAGSSFGVGYTYFAVGGGITIFEPFFNSNNFTFNSHAFQVGNIVHIGAQVTSPNGNCCVSAGSYTAYFYLNTPSGKLQGSTVLSYSSQLWQGSFTIPSTADQGPWIIALSGTDLQGNRASAYEWMYVGLNTVVTTDSPNYVAGDPITILATPSYSGGAEAVSGSFTATVSSGSRFLANFPLEYNPLLKSWSAVYRTTRSDPAGYYNITVSGIDGLGNYGISETVVRVGQYNLGISASLASREISVVNGTESYVSAKLTYPNGTLVRSGSVEAYIGLDFGGAATLLLGQLRMTYQLSTQSFVAINILNSQNISDKSVGKYDVVIQAFDPYGSYGNYSISFFVTGLHHAPISIASDSSFTSSNGVVNGSGTLSNPYVIEGWNASSITVSGSGITSSYVLMNDWVSGSLSDGVSIDTPSSPEPALSYVFSSSNRGNGIYVANTQAVNLNLVAAFDNGGNGIEIVNDSKAANGAISETATASNSLSGIMVENSPGVLVQSSFAVSNAVTGVLVEDSSIPTIALNYAVANPTGIEVSGTQAYDIALVDSNVLLNDKVGIMIDGMDQAFSSGANFSSLGIVLSNVEANDSLGILAVNHAFVRAENNTIGYGVAGVSAENSLPLVIGNVIAYESGYGISVSGMASIYQQCRVILNNTHTFTTEMIKYSSCIAQNTVDSSSSGITMSNINGSFVFMNNVTNGGGFSFNNASSAGIFSNLALNDSEYGISLKDSTRDNVSYNALGFEKNGLVVTGGSSNVIEQNNASLNSIYGIMLMNTQGNLVENNTLSSNSGSCTQASNCSLGAGIELLGSSSNNITLNTVSKSSAKVPSLGIGILFDSGSSKNTATNNTFANGGAGIGFAYSSGNSATMNMISNNTYGIYLLHGSQNSYSGNILVSNGQDIYPNTPNISFTAPENDSTVNGGVSISWSVSGQEISNSSITINGQTFATSGSSYLWNTTSLPDATYAISVSIADAGGFTASSSINLLTDNVALNNHPVTVEVLTPNREPISGIRVTLSNSSVATSLMTNTSGQTTFHDLRQGAYQVSAAINGTSYYSDIQVISNSTFVVLIPTRLVTSVFANSSSGSVTLQVAGNVTGAQISNATFSDLSGAYQLSFQIEGRNGTTGNLTLSIPKGSSTAPTGRVPVLFIDGARVASSYSQDSTNYYVTFSVDFTTHNIVLQFNSPANPLAKIQLLIFGIIALLFLAAALVIVKRSRNKRSEVVLQV
ncbi:MAG: NosD domain-containing protein [Nitrososphaerales archaeon]